MGNKTARKTVRAKAAKTTVKEPTICICGCGKTTKGGRFLPGHDAKLKYSLIQQAVKGGKRAIAQIAKLGWGKHLQDAQERYDRQHAGKAPAKVSKVKAPRKAVAPVAEPEPALASV